jgi:DNA primase
VIAPETIRTIKERTDLVALIGESIRLQRRGRSYVGLCPFHKEKSPSFHVHAERRFYHCFGCGESGSAIDFVMKTSGLDFREAAVMLAERAGIAIEEVGSTEARRDKSERDELYAVNQLAASFWERQLSLTRAGSGVGHPLRAHALAELEKRGMPPLGTDTPEARRWLDTLQAFRVGYAPPGWDGLAGFLREQGVSPLVAERAGLLVPRQGQGRGHYDRFRHRLMFAVVDPLGRVVAFSGRALAPPTRAELERLGPGAPSYDGEAPAKYINSPESPIYTKGEHLFGLHQAKQALRARGEAVLVEGNFDVVSLHARGVDHAIAPLGTAFTPDQAKLLKRFAPRVNLLFDGDAAGRKATRAAREPCRLAGLEARVTVLPEGRDPDELVRHEGPEALLTRLRAGRGLLEHLIDEALTGRGFDDATLAERVKRIRDVVALLSEEDDPNIRSMAKLYADQLSKKLVLGGQAPADLHELERMVEGAFSSARRRGADAPPAVRTPPAPRGARALELPILGAILDVPDLLRDPAVLEALRVLEGDAALAVAAVRRHLLQATSDAEEFLATLPESIQAFASGRLASPTFEEAAEAKAEVLDNAHKLRGLGERREKSEAIEKLAGSTLDEESRELLRALSERARRAKLGG